MKSTLLVIATLFIIVSGYSQKLISGKIINEKGEPLAYATVAMLNPGDSTLMFFGVTNTEGKYQIKNIKEGKYILQFSYVGMKVAYDNITVSSGSNGDLGTKTMSSNTLKEVEVIAEYVPLTFKNDTVEYNAKAFETKPDAVAEDLLKKIPGVEVDESGNVKALGEDVKKVLVDGKEFFGKDIKVATKNIPANAIEKVQVYDKKSEEADFMGIDDGVRDRTINLLLNKDHKKGYFGDITGGYGTWDGTDDYYLAEARVYRFSSKLQSAILGRYNNINDFGYSSKDHREFGRTIDGVNTTMSGGLNFSYNISDQKRYFISYLASSTEKILEQNTASENFIKSNSYFQDTETDEEQTDSPHAINFGVRHKFNSNAKLTIDGDLNLSSNNLDSYVFTSTSDDSLISTLGNTNTTESYVTGANAKAVYIQKFNEEKTQLKTKLYGNYNLSYADKNIQNNYINIFPAGSSLIELFQINNTEDLNISVNPSLVQKLKTVWSVTTDVDFESNISKLDRRNRISNVAIDSLSADFSTEQTTIRPAITLQRGTSQSQIKLTVGAQLDQFNKVYTGVSEVIMPNSEEQYIHFTPEISYENNYKQGRRFKIEYETEVNMPTVTQLLPIVNTINPLSLYQGNNELTPEYIHDFSVSWAVFDQFSFTSMFSRLGASYTQDKIGSSQAVNDDFVRVITPVNVPYSYDAYSFVYFSTPYRPLGIKINIRSNERWNKGISIINNIDNINTSFVHNLKINIENRNKKKWDVNVGGSVSLTDSRFSLDKQMNNIYYTTSYFAQLRFTQSEKWSFDADGSMMNINSKTFNESFSIPLLGAGVSYFFGKSEKASLTLKAYDLLDKSSNISQTSSSNYIIYSESNTIGRYVMLIFKMKLGKQGM